MNNVLIENVAGYVYLGQHYSLKEKNQDKEIQRRIMAGCATYAKHRDISKSNLAICLKRQVYNSCVLPAMTYGAETWTLTKQAQNKLAAAQTKMERSMLNITYKDRRTNIWVRERKKLIDIIMHGFPGSREGSPEWYPAGFIFGPPQRLGLGNTCLAMMDWPHTYHAWCVVLLTCSTKATFVGGRYSKVRDD